MSKSENLPMVSEQVMEPELEPKPVPFTQRVATPTYILNILCVFAYMELHIA